MFGHYGEASEDVHSLLSIAADKLSAKRWRTLGARSAAEARSFFVNLVRRRLGCFAMREMARHRLRRIPYIGMTRAALQVRVRRGGGQVGGGEDGAGVRSWQASM